MKLSLILTVFTFVVPLAAMTPAESAVAAAKSALESNPGQFQAYNALAAALSRRARETSDTGYYRQAEEALAKSLKLSPGNLEAEKGRVWILLGRHEFGKAREAAMALNQRSRDDIMIYAYLTDASVELGRYDDAEKAAQRMLDLRPGNQPGLIRGAYLRELFGDMDGASDFLQKAMRMTRPNETEDRAWLLVQMAHLETVRGRLTTAATLLSQALNTFPEYHYALSGLARVRTAQKKYAEAAELLRRHVAAAPHPENYFALGEALERAGSQKEAGEVFRLFEQKARAEKDGFDNANRELIFYYCDYAKRPEEALAVAELEVSRRKDVHTLDAYAWALYRNGQYEKARENIETALSVGIQDASILYHAGEITSKLKQNEQAAKYFRQSLQVNPTSEYSTEAQDALSKLTS